MSGSCESCGAEETRLYGVRRRYVTPEAWGQPGSDRVVDEIEQWCFACCAHYPHVPLSD